MPLHPTINWPELRLKVRKALKEKGYTQTELSKDLALLLDKPYNTAFRHSVSRYLTVEGMAGRQIKRPALKVVEAFSNWLSFKG